MNQTKNALKQQDNKGGAVILHPKYENGRNFAPQLFGVQNSGPQILGNSFEIRGPQFCTPGKWNAKLRLGDSMGWDNGRRRRSSIRHLTIARKSGSE